MASRCCQPLQTHTPQINNPGKQAALHRQQLCVVGVGKSLVCACHEQTGLTRLPRSRDWSRLHLLKAGSHVLLGTTSASCSSVPGWAWRADIPSHPAHRAEGMLPRLPPQASLVPTAQVPNTACGVLMCSLPSLDSRLEKEVARKQGITIFH